MRRPLASALLACAAGLAGCAGGGLLPARHDGAGTVQAPAMTAQRALATLAPGTSTQADVSRALGRAIVVHFDSGYEVWVYRWDGGGPARAESELVILMGPDGIVKKARVRSGPA
ncbi:hypothetical protein [Caenimonas aquaedulcis]|uniref:Lipoprotein SmpA/OmlA domain-containing protein n=1 Tax=Caenimonas aquaedulcis TaxID=2793270 RepID=A0A931H6T2_9BURK|nr:hypothetical protein [Caenimonas aquaedulcis]MBG9389593.1 hypothetical protein [Caenimonas aquaedulcis]